MGLRKFTSDFKTGFNANLKPNEKKLDVDEEKRRAALVHLGNGLKGKHIIKVNNYVVQWLDKDEKVIALFNANRMKPTIDGVLLTSNRIIAIKGMGIGEIKIVDEIAADDILDFIPEKGLGKTIKLFVTKKDGEKINMCSMSQEDISVANSFLPKMSGKPKRIVKEPPSKEEKRNAKKLSKEHSKAVEAARVEARGRELGAVLVDYIGGYGPEYKKKRSGWLNCYENEVYFKKRDITIPAEQIVSFEITGKQQTKSRLSVTRMVTLGVFSLAAPKRSTEKEASIYIGLKDGRRLFFHTTTYTELAVHKRLMDAISHYGSLQAAQSSQEQPTSSIQRPNVAEEIAQFAKLRKQGVITDEEFEAKKKKLLEL